MIKDSLKAVGGSARDLFGDRGGLALLNALYLLLLASVYLFFSTGVANAWQLVVSAATALAAPLLFLVLQAAAANSAVGGRAGFVALLRRALRDFLKVLLLALPVVALAVGLFYLLGWLEGPPKPEAAAATPTTFGPSGVSPGPKPEPLRWREAVFSSLWILSLGVFVPLVAAHLWLSAARAGLGATLKGIHRVVGRAFAPRSLLVYVVGMFVFALMPYFVLFTRTPVSNGWAELALFGLRLALAFVFTLWGWTITLGALARVTPPATAAIEGAAVEGAATDETPPPAATGGEALQQG